jgi:hypothetical protein
MNGVSNSSLLLCASYALVFKKLAGISELDEPVAYLPFMNNFACDAILVPATDSDGPLIDNHNAKK